MSLEEVTYMNYYEYQDYLAHYGVKGMKWGVRRYQNADGTLTNAGKKRLVKDITSRKRSEIDASYNARNFARQDKNINNYRSSNAIYKDAKKKMDEYRKIHNEYWSKYNKHYYEVIDICEKKYGRYADLERKSDISSMKNFDDTYRKEMNKRGMYKLETKLEKKRTEAYEARELVENETRKYVSDYLGKYGNSKLKGQGSAIYKGGKVVDRIRVNDIMTKAIMEDDFYHVTYSYHRR